MAGRHVFDKNEKPETEPEVTADPDIQNPAPAQYTAPDEAHAPTGNGPAQLAEGA